MNDPAIVLVTRKTGGLFSVIITFIVAASLIKYIPKKPILSQLDRSLLSLLVGEAGEIEGKGAYENPYKITKYEVGKQEKAVLMTLQENDEGWFESVPPPPSDIAVVLNRLREKGLRSLAIAYPLQWQAEDILAVETARAVMDKYENLVLGYSLRNATSGIPMPRPFLRASIPMAEVQGNISDLPVVNDFVGQSPELGGEKTLAGFTQLINEREEDSRMYMLARWGDRVIFSLPLAMEIAQNGASFTEVYIHIGKEIRVGKGGVKIPIDFRGRARFPEKKWDLENIPLQNVIAQNLPEYFPPKNEPVYWGEGRLLGPKEDLEWSNKLGWMDAIIRGAPRQVKFKTLRRFNEGTELGILAVLSLLAGVSLQLKSRKSRLFVGMIYTALILIVTAIVALLFNIALLPLALGVIPIVVWLMNELFLLGKNIEIVERHANDKAQITPPNKKSSQEEVNPNSNSKKKLRSKKNRKHRR